MSGIITLPGSSVTIEPAIWRDVKDLHQLEKVCFQLDAWPLLDILGVLTIPQVIRLKAVAQESMVGFIAVDLRRSQQTAWIATLGVLPQYRKSGIGSALILASEEKVDLPCIRLCVRQSNQPAIEFYQKHGYQQVDVWNKYYRGKENALVFEKMIR